MMTTGNNRHSNNRDYITAHGGRLGLVEENLSINLCLTQEQLRQSTYSEGTTAIGRYSSHWEVAGGPKTSLVRLETQAKGAFNI